MSGGRICYYNSCKAESYEVVSWNFLEKNEGGLNWIRKEKEISWSRDKNARSSVHIMFILFKDIRLAFGWEGRGSSERKEREREIILIMSKEYLLTRFPKWVTRCRIKSPFEEWLSAFAETKKTIFHTPSHLIHSNLLTSSFCIFIKQHTLHSTLILFY
jgi:hypothetical protein